MMDEPDAQKPIEELEGDAVETKPPVVDEPAGDVVPAVAEADPPAHPPEIEPEVPEIEESITVLIVGARRVPLTFREADCFRPTKPIMGAAARTLYRRLSSGSSSWSLRCAIKNDRGLHQEIQDQGHYRVQDFELRFVPPGAVDPITASRNDDEDGIWLGTSSPSVWNLARRFQHAKLDERIHGQVLAEGLNCPPLVGKDLMSIEVDELRETKEFGRFYWYWTDPRALPERLSEGRIDSINSLRTLSRFFRAKSSSDRLRHRRNARSF